MLIKRGAVTLAGIKTKGVSIAKEPIDITSDDDNGYRTFLAEAATKALDLSFSGVTKDKTLRAQIISEQSQLLTDITLEYPDGDKISGDFFFNGFSENGGGSDGAVEFDGTLQSSGAWTYTAAV